MKTTKDIGDQLENFTVEALKAALGEDFEVLPKQIRHGREIDVLLEPKRQMLTPIFISCKNEKAKPEVDHVWNWAQLTQVGGAGRGIIVATAGFTDGEIDFARNPERRLQLWHCRPIRPSDLDVHGITVQGTLLSRPRIWDLKLAIRRPVGTGDPSGTSSATDVMSDDNHKRWVYQCENGEFGNLWDDILQAASTVPLGGPQRIDLPTTPAKFLWHKNERVSVQALSFMVHRGEINLNFTIDLLAEFPYVFENAVTGEISRLVPFNLHKF